MVGAGSVPRWIAAFCPLVDDGLVRIESGPDRRERLIAITKKGNGRLVRAYPRWVEVQQRIVNPLGDQEWPAAMKTLKNIRAALGHVPES